MFDFSKERKLIDTAYEASRELAQGFPDCPIHPFFVGFEFFMLKYFLMDVKLLSKLPEKNRRHALDLVVEKVIFFLKPEGTSSDKVDYYLNNRVNAHFYSFKIAGMDLNGDFVMSSARFMDNMCIASAVISKIAMCPPGKDDELVSEVGEKYSQIDWIESRVWACVSAFL